MYRQSIDSSCWTQTDTRRSTDCPGTAGTRASGLLILSAHRVGPFSFLRPLPPSVGPLLVSCPGPQLPADSPSPPFLPALSLAQLLLTRLEPHPCSQSSSLLPVLQLFLAHHLVPQLLCLFLAPRPGERPHWPLSTSLLCPSISGLCPPATSGTLSAWVEASCF